MKYSRPPSVHQRVPALACLLLLFCLTVWYIHTPSTTAWFPDDPRSPAIEALNDYEHDTQYAADIIAQLAAAAAAREAEAQKMMDAELEKVDEKTIKEWYQNREIDAEAHYVENGVKNATLGFETIFVITLPNSQDKLDAMSISASLSSLYLRTVKGYSTSDFLPKEDLASASSDPGQSMLAAATRAHSRGHLDALRKIVEERRSSALILEEDADWDVDIKEILGEVAEGAKFVGLSGRDKVDKSWRRGRDSPYGNEWDLIWLGHCGGSAIRSSTRHFAVHNDPTVPPPNHRYNPAGVPEIPLSPEAFSSSPSDANLDVQPLLDDTHTRLIYRGGQHYCAWAYAVTFSGAQKILASSSIQSVNSPIDTALGGLCAEEKLKCVSVFPQVFGRHIASPGGEASSTSRNEYISPSRKPSSSAHGDFKSSPLKQAPKASKEPHDQGKSRKVGEKDSERLHKDEMRSEPTSPRDNTSPSSDQSAATTPRRRAGTPNIMRSVRLNVWPLLEGRRDAVTTQWDDVEPVTGRKMRSFGY